VCGVVEGAFVLRIPEPRFFLICVCLVTIKSVKMGSKSVKITNTVTPLVPLWATVFTDVFGVVVVH
jgi:hypothetical protein